MRNIFFHVLNACYKYARNQVVKQAKMLLATEPALALI